MIGGQGEDSCGKSGLDEAPQEPSYEKAHRPPAESEALYGYQQRCKRLFILEHLSNLLVFKWK
ncbi:hypothetical protein [Priestia megaterium]|uniref:hypothetical protein n=1 Tax=Priestia megaterium TaxID=1404 RepID=UPI001866F02F|nr:hypothetical protein [Priestia megaterium]MBE2975259.1 hypothetical protein [Priestia megaterium]MCY9021687.1 hypothetical protein [Priestia megaterium]MED3930044.1 hypothetical protein [Priestia megaterium]